MPTLAALVAPVAGFSQQSNDELRARERALIEEIQDERARDGVYAPGSIESLTALALLYQETGDHGLAVAAFEEALQALRANHGLFAFEQVPLLRALIRSEKARGNFEEAWRKSGQLLELALRYPAELETALILLDVADAQIEVLQAEMTGRISRRFDARILAPESPGGSDRSLQLLSHARTNYRRAANLLTEAELYSSPLLREIETKLLRAAWYRPRSYTLGWDVYRRLAIYDETSGAPLLQRMTTQVEAADWALLFMDKHPPERLLRRVLGVYEAAYRGLDEGGVAEESIDALFSPAIPVVLPTFLPNRFVTAPTPETVGYVDIAFDVTEIGFAERIEVVGAENAPRSAARSLVRQIRQSRFRPRLTAGYVERASRVVVRYYVTE